MEGIVISMFPLSSWLGGCYGNVFAYTELWCFSGRSLISSMQLGWNSVLFGCLERHIPPCNIFKMVKAGSFCVYFLWEKWVQVGLQLKKCVIGWRTVAGSRGFNGLLLWWIEVMFQGTCNSVFCFFTMYKYTTPIHFLSLSTCDSLNQLLQTGQTKFVDFLHLFL